MIHALQTSFNVKVGVAFRIVGSVMVTMTVAMDQMKRVVVSKIFMPFNERSNRRLEILEVKQIKGDF